MKCGDVILKLLFISLLLMQHSVNRMPDLLTIHPDNSQTQGQNE